MPKLSGGGGGSTDHSALTNLPYTAAGHTGFEPTVTKGNLTAGSSKVSIGGAGTGAVIGAGASVDVNTGTTAGTVAAGDDSRITGAAQKASNLSDLANAATARSNLGLGSAAVEASSAFAAAAKGVTNGDSHDHIGGDGAAIVEAAITLSDNITNDVSTTRHGFVPKAPNLTTQFLRGDGTWAVPGASGANTALSNLAAVAVNISIISDTDSTDDLGSSTIAWANVYADAYRSAAGVDMLLKPDDAQDLVIQTAPVATFYEALRVKTNGVVWSEKSAGSAHAMPATGAGIRLIWIPATSIFIAAEATGTQLDGPGDHSVIFGHNNTCSGVSYTFLGSGSGNSVSANYAAVVGGRSNSVSGSDSFACNYSNTVSGAQAFACGLENTVSAEGGSAFGRGGDSRMPYQQTLSPTKFAATGDAQTSLMALRVATSDATQTEMPIDGGSTYLSLENDTSYLFQVDIIARNTATDSDSAAYHLTFECDRGANAAATRVNGLSVTTIYEDTAAYDVTVTADTTNGRPAIKVTGAAATSLRWVARVEITEVSG